MSSEATVYVVDDDAAVLAALKRLLEAAQLRVETFESAAGFLERCGPEMAGCLVLDLRMPGMDGLELQQRLMRAGFRLPVIMISAHGEVESAVLAMKGGAVDFLRKPYQPKVLLERIRQALELDAQRRVDDARRRARETALAELTPRERDVFDRLIAGMTAKQIALELGVSRKTVDIHRTHVLLKLRVPSVVDLMRVFHGTPPAGRDVS